MTFNGSISKSHRKFWELVVQNRYMFFFEMHSAEVSQRVHQFSQKDLHDSRVDRSFDFDWSIRGVSLPWLGIRFSMREDGAFVITEIISDLADKVNREAGPGLH